MNEPAIPKTYAEFILPASVVSKIDVSRLVREVEWVDNELTAATVRAKSGLEQQTTPTLSGALTDFLSQNQLTIGDSKQRSELIAQLRLLKEKTPVIHMTFAVPADRESLEQLATWLRTSVHRQAVISVGLQPALVAGVYLRTPNQVDDFSVRGMLAQRHDVLVKELGALRG